jgi:hypothetical protein
MTAADVNLPCAKKPVGNPWEIDWQRSLTMKNTGLLMGELLGSDTNRNSWG